jgi:hypothetical protein
MFLVEEATGRHPAGRRKITMEHAIPIEECAQQRLNVLVNAYTLFIKNLMEEGLDRDKVRRASDRAWEMLGIHAAEQLRPLMGDKVDLEGLRQAGQIAEEIHGMAVKTEISGKQLHTDFIGCPWQEALQAHAVPKEWRMCASGHSAFVRSMYNGLHPGATYELKETMPAGASRCKGISTL